MVKAKPFVKWAGGKRNIAEKLKELFPHPDFYDKYVEPFVGGGAMLFELTPEYAIIADSNDELMNAYQVIKDDVNALIRELAFLETRNDKESFHDIRSARVSNMETVARAARFIYLNKTSFNGLYRVNKKGQYNTSYGYYKNPNILDIENLRAIRDYLNSNEVYIQTDDFRCILQREINLTGWKADERSFIYCDPPYLPLSDTANFVSYTPDKFDIRDHTDLYNLLVDIHHAGILFGISMSNTEWAREAYGRFKVHYLTAKRAIAADADSRGDVSELYITNYRP
jgi:DNA adenine methylase